MASLRSLGVHTPAALPHLIAESILLESATEGEYRWETYDEPDSSNIGEEELVITEYCVTYSVGGIVQKVYNFEIEQEKVVDAVLTTFISPNSRSLAKSSSDGKSKGITKQKLLRENIARIKDTWHDEQQLLLLSAKRSRAVVIFLKSQAHVFFLSGPSHVVNLPFEVEKVFPAPRGLIIQRKISPESIAPTPIIPSAPQNSFFSNHSWSQPYQRLSSSFGSVRRSKNLVSSASSSLLPDDFLKGAISQTDGLPRLFSFTDPLSEFGLVVNADSTTRTSSLLAHNGQNELESIDKAEELLYVSRQNEMASRKSTNDRPLILIVTANYKSGMYTVWYAAYLDSRPAASKDIQRVPSVSVSKTRRRSSYGPTPGPGTGATTPAIRIRDSVRESFGGAGRNKAEKPTAEETFASQVDPEFNLQGQTTRDPRRVSSLLSRADLSTSFDKTAFQDLATHHSGLNASFGAGSRRGHSLGGYNDRASFGGNSQARLRASTPGSVSRISLGGASVDETLEDIDDTEYSQIDDYDALDELLAGTWGEAGAPSLHEPLDGLKKEMVLVKLTELPITISRPREASMKPKTPLKVFTMAAPWTHGSSEKFGRLYLHIFNSSINDHIEMELSIQRKCLSPGAMTNKHGANNVSGRFALVPVAAKSQRLNGDIDILKIKDKVVERIVSLSRDRSGNPTLSLYAGWSHRVSPKFSFEKLKNLNPYAIQGASPMDSRMPALHNVQKVQRLSSPSHGGIFDVVDDTGSRHRLQLQMWPRNSHVSRLLSVVQLVLPYHHGDMLLMTWWHVHQMLRHDQFYNNDWSTFVVTLFTLAAPFLDGPSVGSKVNTRLRGGPRRAAKGASQAVPVIKNQNRSPWDSMWACEGRSPAAKSWNNAAWAWTKNIDTSSGKGNNDSDQDRNDFIPSCVSFSKQFMESPVGKAVNDHWRHMSTSEAQDLRSLYLPKLLLALHIYREELKLSLLTPNSSTYEMGNLAPVLAQIGHWLRWNDWNWEKGSYYELDGAAREMWLCDESTFSFNSIEQPPWETPPSIYAWIEKVTASNYDQPFPTLATLIDQSKIPTSVPNHDERRLSDFTPKTVALVNFFKGKLNAASTPSAAVELMSRSGINSRMLETLPSAVVAPLKEAIIRCQASPPTAWSDSLLSLIGREDLDVGRSNARNRDYQTVHIHITTNTPSQDVHSICQTVEQFEPALSSYEIDRFMIARLIFNEDRRYAEAAKLLEPIRQAVAECIPDPQWSEAQYLDEQKKVVQWVMLRTFALPPGNAMIKFNSKRPLLTEKFPLHGFTTSCLMKPMNNIVTADRSNYTEEKFGWAFFHAGVSAGLSIARGAEGIDTSWIMFNKPAELTNKHAGLLLGLGLTGHLKTIAKWLSFKYLTPKHTMTSVGLLLGLSASFLGTMDTLVTRLLSVHVTRMLPPGAAELNLSPFTQTTGLMGIGLLYCDTQHRRMSEVMLSEIEYVELPDPSDPPETLRDEGYRLAAGFALGLINIGKGKDLRGLHDMRIVERLLAVAVGPKPVDIVHILDQATAGATIAIALIFMKTQDEAVARKVDVPDTLPQFDYVRPDIFLLRTVAKHLILWDNIRAEHRWMIRNLPIEYRDDHLLQNIKQLRSEHMPFYNIIAGLLWSISLRYAGSGDSRVRDFIIKYLDQFMRLCRLPALRYDAKLTRNCVRNCQDLVAISAATIMAGTGDLDVLRRLRSLHSRVGPDIPYGSHFATHLALGVLFLGGGTYTFGTSNLAIASLMCAFYPLFPMDVLDNKAHLQAFRHFWVLAAEPRCMVIRDVDTRRAISLPVIINLKDGTEKQLAAPCLLPEFSAIASIKTDSPEYWQVTLDFVNNPTHLAAFNTSRTIHVRRRPPHEAHSSTFSASLIALNDAQASHTARLMWNWIFSLPQFSDFDRAAVGLIIPNDVVSSVHMEMKGTVVDDRLMLREAVKSGEIDRLWDLRVVFEWAEKVQSEGGRLRWLGREVLERLKAGIIERSRIVETSNE